MDGRTDADIKINFISPATEVHIRKVIPRIQLNIGY